MTDSTTRIELTLTLDQASAVSAALEFYMRVGIGQIDEVAELMRQGTLPRYRAGAGDGERQHITADTIQAAEDHLLAVKALLGFPRNGSHGIGQRDNHITVNRSYEVLKVLDKTVAELRNPVPTMRGVEYDGLTVRYTNDPRPECQALADIPAAEIGSASHQADTENHHGQVKS